MGEPQEHIHSFNPTQLKAIIEALTPQAPAPEPPAEAPLLTLATLLEAGVEPWTFHDPHQKCDVTAFLDPQHQIRHVPTSRSSEVPNTWRRVLLA
jgi:hypothetical protein